MKITTLKMMHNIYVNNGSFSGECKQFDAKLHGSSLENYTQIQQRSENNTKAEKKMPVLSGQECCNESLLDGVTINKKRNMRPTLAR